MSNNSKTIMVTLTITRNVVGLSVFIFRTSDVALQK